MGRPKRVTNGGLIYHVLNRGNSRMTLFEKDEDYEAFQRILYEGLSKFPGVRLIAYCLMPNHWHLVVWPQQDGQLQRFTGWLTLTHTQRHHAHHHSAGEGHVYQGRYKSFVVQDSDYFFTLVRYVERNPLRANLVSIKDGAQAWRYGSLYRWLNGEPADQALLSPWPVVNGRKGRLPDWITRVNRPVTKPETEQIKHSIMRSCPYGDNDWMSRIADHLGLQTTLTPRGRPKLTK